MKNIYVAFTQSGARVFKTEKKPVVRGAYEILENPVLPIGVPPHLWLAKNGKIEVLEQQQAVKAAELKAQNMNWQSMNQKYVKPKWQHYAETALIALIVSGLVKWLI